MAIRLSRWLSACIAAFALVGVVSSASAQIPTVSTRAGSATTAEVQAMLDSGTDGIHSAISWARAEPQTTSDITDVPKPGEPPNLGREYVLSQVAPWQAAPGSGIDVLNLRVVDSPAWTRGGGPCVDMCPPAPAHYHDLYEFMRDLVEVVGPDTLYDVDEFSFWNEPNDEANWGGVGFPDAPRQYSDLLLRFTNGAGAAPGPAPRIVAGEVTGGGCCEAETNRWSREFAAIARDLDRLWSFNAFAVHPYSEFPGQVAGKIRSYKQLFPQKQILPTEFGWAIGTPGEINNPNEWKCASAGEQATKFRRTVEEVDEVPGVDRLVWFNGIDNIPAKVVKCHDPHYAGLPDGGGPDHPNSFGLFRLDAAGLPTTLEARPVCAEFRTAATGVPATAC